MDPLIPTAARDSVRPTVAEVVLLAAAGLLLVVAFAVGTANSVWALWPVDFGAFYAGVIALIIAGAVLLRVPEQRSNGRLMIAIAAGSSALDLLSWQAGPGPFVFGILYWLVPAMFVHLLLRWPDTRLRTPARRSTIWVAYLVPAALTLVSQVMWDPAWFRRDTPSPWWLTLAPNEGVANALFVAAQIVYIAVIAAVFAFLWKRVAAGSPTVRREVLPVAIAAVLLGGVTLIRVAQGLGWVTDIDSSALQNLAVLSVPLAALVGVALGRREDAAHRTLVPAPLPD
jgi:hypothetical protein